jgi:Protein of unknown function (DUF4240)
MYLHQISYLANLWGTAFLMNGGASDDGFDYFRGWLISQGRKVFEAALENPDSLSDVIDKDAEADFEFENASILNVAVWVWQTKTGLETDEFYTHSGQHQSKMPSLAILMLGATGPVTPTQQNAP